MKSKKSNQEQGYRIGAVSKITGIAPETLRIWERRYNITTPRRTAAGGRLYDKQDIARLALIKSLVDGGDSISSVAGLDYAQLQARLNKLSHARAITSAAGRDCRLLVLGETIGMLINSASPQLEHVSIVGNFSNNAEFENAAAQSQPDVLLVEMPTLHEDSASQIVDWMQMCGAMHVIVVYRYCNSRALERLPVSRCTVMRAPLDVVAVQRHCRALIASAIPVDQGSAPATSADSIMLSPRKYDDQTLARVAMHSSAVRCECPRHLSELIGSLAAFEQYSTECESRSPEDAALHAYLTTAAGHARVLIEDALTRVIEIEQIEL